MPPGSFTLELWARGPKLSREQDEPSLQQHTSTLLSYSTESYLKGGHAYGGWG